MFHRWGFLLGEIWGLLALAALLGLFVGWLIWGRRSAVAVDTGEADRLRSALEACSAKGREAQARIAALEGEVKAAQAAAHDAHIAAENARADAAAATVSAAVSAAPAPAPMAAMAAPLMAAPAAEPAASEKVQPKGLTEARGGKADDLKLIKGVGPKLEALCHRLGFYHFDQIANWTAAEIAWVDENLEGFKGRVTRDEWVVQARDLAAGMAPRPGGEH